MCRHVVLTIREIVVTPTLYEYDKSVKERPVARYLKIKVIFQFTLSKLTFYYEIA